MFVLAGVSAPVSYHVLDRVALDECVSLMSEIFANGEPLTKILGISATEFQYFAEVFASKAVEDELAVYARDRETGRMLGFCLSEDLCAEPPGGAELISEKFNPIMAIVTRLDEWFAEVNHVEKGRFLHIFMTGISKTCRYRDVSTSVVAENLRIAKEKGYRAALGESTTTLAARAANRNGFKEEHAIAYNDFYYDGKPVFAQMGARAKCRLMVKWFD